jgi:hypothetical protein
VNNDLFFIPPIARALGTPHPEEALADAFQRIRVMGAETPYRRGAVQFRRFMASARERTRVDFVVELNGRYLASVPVYPFEGMASIAGILPGAYSVKLWTGRVLWESELSEADLLWASAFPGRSLALAADTAPADRLRSRRELLLGGELCLHVFPGVESGEIGIERR